MVKAKGGPVPGYRDLDTHPENWISNLDVARDGGDKIGVGPVLEARDMANPNVEYLGVMAWAAQFQWIADKTPPGDRVQIQLTWPQIYRIKTLAWKCRHYHIPRFQRVW